MSKHIENQTAFEMSQMRERSGSVTLDCKLTSFLYTLMRDYVHPGDLENIMLHHISDEPSVYTNGWLAKYAEDIANRLKTKAVDSKFRVIDNE